MGGGGPYYNSRRAEKREMENCVPIELIVYIRRCNCVAQKWVKFATDLQTQYPFPSKRAKKKTRGICLFYI